MTRSRFGMQRIFKRSKYRNISNKTTTHVIFSISLFFVFLLLTVAVRIYPVNSIDIKFSRFLQAADWAVIFKTTNAVFNELTLRFLCIILIIFWAIRKRFEIVMLFVLSMVIEIVSFIIKHIIRRPRPSADLIDVIDKSGGFSYISGHTFEYSFFFWILAVIVYYYKPLKLPMPYRSLPMIFLLIMPIVVGLSRIYVGDHWLTDVIGSYLLAGCAVIIIKTSISRTIGSRVNSIKKSS